MSERKRLSDDDLAFYLARPGLLLRHDIEKVIRELQERRASSPAAVDETDNVTPILKMHGRVMVNLPFERVPRSATDPGIGALPEDPLKECAMHVFAARKLHQLIVKYMAGSAQEALSSLGDDGEIHAAVHDALSGKCAQEWIDEQIRTSSPAAGRDAVIEECAKVAEAGVLMFDGAPDVKLGCEMASKVMLHAIRALKS